MGGGIILCGLHVHRRDALIRWCMDWRHHASLELLDPRHAGNGQPTHIMGTGSSKISAQDRYGTVHTLMLRIHTNHTRKEQSMT
jgi:hypothetical protein